MIFFSADLHVLLLEDLLILLQRQDDKLVLKCLSTTFSAGYQDVKVTSLCDYCQCLLLQKRRYKKQIVAQVSSVASLALSKKRTLVAKICRHQL